MMRFHHGIPKFHLEQSLVIGARWVPQTQVHRANSILEETFEVKRYPLTTQSCVGCYGNGNLGFSPQD